MEIILTVNKERVWEEVAQTASYAGDKMVDDEDAYERMMTTDEDRSKLERFWDESCATVCERLKQMLGGEELTSNGDYRLKLKLSNSFDTTLRDGMEKELMSFIVLNITAKWFAFTNKKEAGDYASGAREMLESVHRKAVFKRKPTRPVY
mgnify:CR=1 FL=1